MREVILHLAAVPAILFPIVYGTTAPWWRSDAGRHTFVLSVLLGLLFVHALLSFWFGDYPGRGNTIRIIYLLALLAMWWRFIALVRIQFLGRRERREARHD